MKVKVISNKKTLNIILWLSMFCCQYIFARNLNFDLIDLGTLKNNGSGFSDAFKVSANGYVITGESDTNTGFSQVFRYNRDDNNLTGLGTLKADNSGHSSIADISANGRVIIGSADTDSGYQQAFRHNEGDNKMTGLGTLKADNSGHSKAYSVSADGRVVVGESITDSGYWQAFRHNEGDSKMTGLGTLKADNSGSSEAYAISADGRVIVGQASTDSGYWQAFRHREGDNKMTGLGGLKADKSGDSRATDVSADGRVVTGYAEVETGASQAFRHNEGDNKITGLGTLKVDNSGASYALAISADGRIIVGQASTDSGSSQAFKHREGDSKMTGLGTFKADNSGASQAFAVSADGSIVVGHAQDGNNIERAFRHTDSEGMIDLGTLKADNSGQSSAFAVSADGSVIVGVSSTDNNEAHAAVWKLKQAPVDPNNPEPPTEIIKVDATNSNKTMTQAAKDAYKVLDLYRSRLMGLSKAECSLDNFSYCVGAFTHYDTLKSNHAWTTGLFGAIRLAPQWSMGLSVDYLVDSSLPDGYGTRGSSNPGVGAFVRFQQHTDKTGFNITASGAYQEQKMDIHRQKLSNTEAGVGNTKVNGQLLDLDVSYGLKASDKVTLFPHTGIRYTKINRDAYHEYKGAEFPAYYGELGEKNTAITLGLATEYYLSDKITVNADAGMRFNLDQNRNAFTGHIDYIGAHVYDFGEQRKNQPFVGVGIKGLVTKQSAVNLQLGWTKQSYDHNTASVGLSYAYRF